MVQNQINLINHSIRSINNLILNKKITITKLCHESLGIINQFKNLNAFITTCEDTVIEKAIKLDECLASGDRNESMINNPLFGVPISIKDNFCTEQLLTTCGSKMLHNFIPPYEATAVKRLTQANCLVVGKTNMDEFAMGSSSTTSYYGPTANHRKSESLLKSGDKPNKGATSQWFMAGGSSTGSAISVALGSCFASLGTDTGGSTRQPASLVGVVGFKPTYGLVSRHGVVPLVNCLDVVSILARKVDDVKLVFNSVIGQDDNDLTTVDHKTELRNPISQKLKLSSTKLRIGIPEEFICKGETSNEVAKQFDKILGRLSDKQNDLNINFEVVKLSLPYSCLSTECYTVISSAEIASNMSCYDGVKYGSSVQKTDNLTSSEGHSWDQVFKENRDAGFGLEVKKRILLGNYFLLSGNREKYLIQALKLRRLISEEFERAFVKERVDIILMPSTPTTSVSYETWLQRQDENKLFREDYFLIPANLANLPSISLPAGFSPEGLPIGLQAIANKFQDLDLLSVSKLFEGNILKDL